MVGLEERSVRWVKDEHTLVEGVRASSECGGDEVLLLLEATNGCSMLAVSGDERAEVELPDGLPGSGYVRRSSIASTPVILYRFC